ncbi:hypothetical protein H0H92_010719 [Tricholoma furcatifolium]|nr:hypothetical protein H0H92_010719 [Tricholoma furcatifolium]
MWGSEDGTVVARHHAIKDVTGSLGLSFSREAPHVHLTQSTMNTQPATGSELSEDPPAYRGLLRPEDLFESPGLANQDPGSGPLVKALFLIYYLTPDVQDNWVQRNHFEYQDSFEVLIAIVEQTSSCHLSYVERENRVGQCPALFIASNETPQDLERALDFDLIKDAANILQTNEPPVWRRPARI